MCWVRKSSTGEQYMCGISGFNFDDKVLLKKMMDLTSHRGPDDNGIYTDKGISLGSLRLSIVDLSKKGHQPLLNKDGSLVITYNGEIYNHAEIRKVLEQRGCQFKSNTDTEVALYAYQEYGPKCLQLFNGEFSFVIYDRKKKLLFGARDRLGIKPFYYVHLEKNKQSDNQFIFCSELKGLLAHDLKREINLDALNWFVSQRFIAGEDTIFKGIKRLLAGHYFTYNLQNNTLAIEKFWDLEYPVLNKSEDYFAEELRKRFKESVKMRLMSDVPLGVYLSGGIDSSSVVAMMRQLSQEGQEGGARSIQHTDHIKTFSVGFGYGGEVDELQHAKLVSEHFQTDHRELMVKSDLLHNLPRVVWYGDEPLADPACLPAFLLSEKVKKYVTVVLAGEGADELFAGYEQNKFLLQRNKLKLIPKPIRSFSAKTVNMIPDAALRPFFTFISNIGKEGRRRFCNYVAHIDNKAQAYAEIMSIFNNEERRELLRPEVIEHIKLFDHTDRINQMYYNDDPHQNNKQQRDYLNQILHYETKEPLAENLLMKADKTTMPFAVECHVPFLDHTFVEFAATIPTHLKLHHYHHEKYILRRAMKDVLPQQIVKRKKHRFYAPIDHWMHQEEVKSLVDDLLGEQTLRRQGYFQQAMIEKIKKNYATSPLFYARQLWTLINFQIWHKLYVEEDLAKKGLNAVHKLGKMF